MKDPQLWKYADHRKRADKLIAQGKPLSIHFGHTMYVHQGVWNAPLWIGDTYVWVTLSDWDSEINMWAWYQNWRRRMVLR